MSKKMHLPKSREDRAKWKGMGNYEEKLLEVYKRYTDEWAGPCRKQAMLLYLSKVLDLPEPFYERVIDYELSKYPERFTLQNCQLTGRKKDISMVSCDLVQKHRDHGFQSLAGFSHGGGRMGSIEMAVLNVIHAQGEYWELWHADGLGVETSTAVAKTWREASEVGYEAYKKTLLTEGRDVEAAADTYRAHGGRRGRAKKNPESETSDSE